jgi:Tfp pilus assembly protein FimT
VKIRKSFTLVELVIIIVITSILAVACFVAISSYQTQYLRAAAERIVNDLRDAKNQALSSTKWTGVIFQLPPANTYSVYTTDGTSDTLIKSPQDPGRDFTVNVAGDYPGVSISGANFDGGNKVEFSPLGVPYPDKSGSALAGTGIVTLSKGSATLTVDVDPQTGRVYIP